MDGTNMAQGVTPSRREAPPPPPPEVFPPLPTGVVVPPTVLQVQPRRCHARGRREGRERVPGAADVKEGGQQGGAPGEARLFHDVKPLWYLMRSLGVFPVHRDGEGRPHYAARSAAMVYSVLVYSAMSVLVYLVVSDRAAIIVSTDSSFDDVIYAVMFLVNLGPQLLLTPCHWHEGGKVVLYLRGWAALQEEMERTLHVPMDLQLRPLSTVLTAVVPAVSCAVILCEAVLIPGMSSVLILFYSYLMSVVHLHAALWYVLCAALGRASGIIARKLAEHSDDGVLCCAHVTQHRRLWLRLSQLTKDTGNFLGVTFCVLCVLWSALVTVCVYGVCTGIPRGPGLRELGMAAYSVLCAGVLYVLCDAAHGACQHVGEDCLQQLLQLKYVNKKTQHQLDFLVQIIALNPPKINFAGYVVVNRGFLSSFFATMVTYLVVLLQFRMGTSDGTTTGVGRNGSSLCSMGM